MTKTRRSQMLLVDVRADHSDSTDSLLFAQQCSPVFTQYTHALHAGETKIRATTSWTRLFLTSDGPTVDPAYRPNHQFVTPTFLVDLNEPADNFGFSDGGVAQIDPTLTVLPPSERGRAYLEWLHGNMMAVARIRAWDEEPLHQARQYCLDRDVKAHFESPRRQSPDRRHKAQLSLGIDPDGFRHLAITVRNRNGAVVAASTQTLRPFFCDFYDWKSLCRLFAWTSDTRIGTEGLGVDLLPDQAGVESDTRGSRGE